MNEITVTVNENDSYIISKMFQYITINKNDISVDGKVIINRYDSIRDYMSGKVIMFDDLVVIIYAAKLPTMDKLMDVVTNIMN